MDMNDMLIPPKTIDDVLGQFLSINQVVNDKGEVVDIQDYAGKYVKIEGVAFFEGKEQNWTWAGTLPNS